MNQIPAYESAPNPFHLVSELTERAHRARALPKRSRTRLSLIAATAAEMERKGYGGLTIECVVREAGVARGTFYLYFANRADAAAAVLRAFRALMRRRRPRGGRRLPPYQAVRRMNRFYVACYEKNAVILAAGEALIRDRPELARKRDFWNDRWARAVLLDLCQRTGASPDILQDKRAVLSVRAVLAMADELLREAFVHKTPNLAPLADDVETVAEVLSTVWHRAVFGEHPIGVDHYLPSNGSSSPDHPPESCRKVELPVPMGGEADEQRRTSLEDATPSLKDLW